MGWFDPLKPSGLYVYHQFNIQQFYVLLTQCICVFCVDLRTQSDYFPTQRKLMEKRRVGTGKDIGRYYIYIITGVKRKKKLL